MGLKSNGQNNIHKMAPIRLSDDKLILVDRNLSGAISSSTKEQVAPADSRSSIRDLAQRRAVLQEQTLGRSLEEDQLQGKEHQRKEGSFKFTLSVSPGHLI